MKHIRRLFAGLLAGAMLLPAAQAVPYTESLRAEERIYDGPGYEYIYCNEVGEDGVYTIVEETTDTYGNLWGRLKSGAGWVLLEEAGIIYPAAYTVSLDAQTLIYDSTGGACVGNVGEDGVYTIIEDMFDASGNLWGRLKSGAGWVLLAETEAAEQLPYTTGLGAWVPLYDAPCGDCTAIVGEDGVYTIVEETFDEAGNLWGRLKSGAGWVNLSYVRMVDRPTVTAYPAELVDPDGALGFDCITDASGAVMRIAIRANARIEDVEFTSVFYNGEGYEAEAVYAQGLQVEKDGYFVVGVVFYGDMTAYGLSFEDENGERRRFVLTLSGLDGMPVLNEYF